VTDYYLRVSQPWWRWRSRCYFRWRLCLYVCLSVCLHKSWKTENDVFYLFIYLNVLLHTVIRN